MSDLPTTPAQYEKHREAFEAWLIERGSAVMAPTITFEVALFSTYRGTGIIYRNDRNRITNWAHGADIAMRAFFDGKPWRARERVSRNLRKRINMIDSLIRRDGDSCTFCGERLGEDMTIEHFVALTSGGPDVLANTCLAHAECNHKVGHMSVREKVEAAVLWRRK